MHPGPTLHHRAEAQPEAALGLVATAGTMESLPKLLTLMPCEPWVPCMAGSPTHCRDPGLVSKGDVVTGNHQREG